MRAMLSVQSGGPETLRVGTLPDPTPGPGEVVIDVEACGVNYFDFLIIRDMHHTIPQRPFAPGGEAAGVVSMLGAGVDDLALGQRVVVGSLNYGGMAEKLLVRADYCNPIPDDMDFHVAAGFSLTYGTSYYGLKNLARLQKNETLLVLGAAGGVGLAAVELGRAMGATVIAAVSSDDKLELAIKHGAHDGVVYPRGPFDKAAAKELALLFKRAVGAGGANVVCDPVGGAYSEAAVRAMAPDGRSLIIGFPAGIPQLPLNLVLLKACQVMGCFWGPWVWREPQASKQNMVELADLFRRGAITPHVSKRFSLEEGGEAIGWIGARQAMGKGVVSVRAPRRI
jgi:NADPH2:quinone reductase